jgi:hypothetical protein
MTILSRLKKWIGRIVANEPCVHQWGRPYDFYQGGSIVERVKNCKLCGIPRTVKRRVKKDEK